jgi:hypothetical protein
VTPLHITVDLARSPWGDIPAEMGEGTLTRIGLMPWSTTDGSPVVAMWIDTASGPLFVQTTYKLFAMAARVFAATATGQLVADEMRWD